MTASTVSFACVQFKGRIAYITSFTIPTGSSPFYVLARLIHDHKSTVFGQDVQVVTFFLTSHNEREFEDRLRQTLREHGVDFSTLSQIYLSQVQPDKCPLQYEDVIRLNASLQMTPMEAPLATVMRRLVGIRRQAALLLLTQRSNTGLIHPVKQRPQLATMTTKKRRKTREKRQ